MKIRTGGSVALFEYECIICNKVTEINQHHSKPNPECPECRGETRKLISRSSFRLKGNGWGNQGYAKGRK